MHGDIGPVSRNVRTGIGIALTALYAAGLVLLCIGLTAAGLGLWGISTVGGMGFLWYCRKREKELPVQDDEQNDDE